MTARVASTPGLNIASVPGWLVAVLLVVGVAAVGASLGGLSRPAFVLACGFVGWFAWRQSPAMHLQAALILFTFAPFVRRVVDLHIGYDQLGLMLIGPLLAILVPVVHLPRQLEKYCVPEHVMWPLGIVAASVVYAGMLSMAQGDWTNAASGMLKWLAPLLYAALLLVSAEREELTKAATSAFAFILPAAGIYAIHQYVDPSDWDIYWMQFAPIPSIGQPVPYGVRVFGTMNAPASFATFTATGLLLIGFSRGYGPRCSRSPPRSASSVAASHRLDLARRLHPVLPSLCGHAPTRRHDPDWHRRRGAARRSLHAVRRHRRRPPLDLKRRHPGWQRSGAPGGIRHAVEPAGRSLFGSGFTITDVGAAGTMPIDGMIIACWLSMGIMVGGFCLSALLWAVGNALAVAFTDPAPEAVVIGALALGALAQVPLANITSGESGFLFWTFAVLLTPKLTPRAAA
jgi:hypothetical protein